MKHGAVIAILVLFAAGAVLAIASAFTVAEYEQAIITEFGAPVGEPITEAGLHWRTPFIQKVHRFEKRLLEHDGDADQMPTRERKNIHIDTFARWRIVDPLQFYKSVRDERGAKTKLNDIIDSETRDAISSHPLIETIRNSNRELPEDADIAEVRSGLEDLPVTPEKEPAGDEDAEGAARPGSQEAGSTSVQIGREAINREILENAAEKISKFGIELVDVQIKAINYVEEVQQSVFDRMVSERQQLAESYRAEGQKVFAEIQGRIEKERNSISSEAYRQAETIKGEAEAEAARIYAEAYGRDPEFYAFWRSIEIYRESLGANTSLVISTDSDFFRYLRSAGLSAELRAGE